MTTEVTPEPVPCPSCGSPAAAWESFCEGCGAELTPSAPAPAAETREAPITLSVPVTREGEQVATAPGPRRPCRDCGGTVDADGYCESCGAKAPSDRDHFEEVVAPWVAGVCDRGIRHKRNEDAMALSAQDTRAVLVVCDGVSSSEDSDVASLAAARAARDVLDGQRPAGLGLEQSQVQALTATLAQAARAANDAVLENTRPESRSPASCTFAAAVVVDDLIVFGNIGDSRVYWIADEGDSVQLSVDDSVAQIQMEQGMSREQAENGPQSHAITRWLGRDAPDLVPTAGSLRVPGDGWLMVCSDGLWNYASAVGDLDALFARALVDDHPAYADPRALADRLVRWACDQGGRDNITVALARFGEARPLPTT
ncbi:PP2C family protein-serine/threonine phosphatase [Mariniluteicoccus flavus]